MEVAKHLLSGVNRIQPRRESHIATLAPLELFKKLNLGHRENVLSVQVTSAGVAATRLASLAGN